TGLVTDADLRVGLTVMDWPECRVRIGHVQQRDVAERLEVEQRLGLGRPPGGGRGPGRPPPRGRNPRPQVPPGAVPRVRLDFLNIFGAADLLTELSLTPFNGECRARSSACPDRTRPGRTRALRTRPRRRRACSCRAASCTIACACACPRHPPRSCATSGNDA